MRELKEVIRIQREAVTRLKRVTEAIIRVAQQAAQEEGEQWRKFKEDDLCGVIYRRKKGDNQVGEWVEKRAEGLFQRIPDIREEGLMRILEELDRIAEEAGELPLDDILERRNEYNRRLDRAKEAGRSKARRDYHRLERGKEAYLMMWEGIVQAEAARALLSEIQSFLEECHPEYAPLFARWREIWEDLDGKPGSLTILAREMGVSPQWVSTRIKKIKKIIREEFKTP